MRREARRDSNRDRNEPEIIAAFEVCGARVWKTLEPVDLLVCWGQYEEWTNCVSIGAATGPLEEYSDFQPNEWRLYAVEIKTPLGPRGGGAKLRPRQEEFFAFMPEAVRHLVRTAADVFALVQPQPGYPSSSSARARALASRGFPSAWK